MRRTIRHLRYAANIWLCNFRGSSRRYWGWVRWCTAWQATRHLVDDRRARAAELEPGSRLNLTDLPVRGTLSSVMDG